MIQISILTLILLTSSVAFARVVPNIFLREKKLQAVISSSVGWGLESLFTPEEIKNYGMKNIRIEGSSPCSINEPSFEIVKQNVHKDSSSIIDFAVIDDFIYYMTKSMLKAYKYNPNRLSSNNNLYFYISMMEHNYTYFDALKFSNGDILFFFKDTEPYFSHAIYKPSTGQLEPILRTDGLYKEFTTEMKLSVFKDYIFIPAGINGLYMYQYMTDTRKLRFISQLNFRYGTETQPDIRDVAVSSNPNANDGELIVILADYNKGIVVSSLYASSLTTNQISLLPEFVKTKSVVWQKQGKENTLILISEGLDEFTKFTVLSFTLGTRQADFKYEQINILDGVAQYGDASDQYTAILMPSSLMVTRQKASSSNDVKYVNSPDISHAKIYAHNSYFGVLLFYTKGSEINTYSIVNSYGFLVCQTKAKETIYDFRILARSNSCPLTSPSENTTLPECDYEIYVNMVVSEKTGGEMWFDTKISLAMVSVVAGVMLIVAIVIFIILFIKNKRANAEILKYEELNKTKDIKHEEKKREAL